jgi:hypothetical protein
MSTSAPALAVSRLPRLGIVFDGGGGANGLLNSAYLNLRSTTGEAITLSSPVTMTVTVVGRNSNVTAERSMTFGSSNGSISKRTYNATMRTTTFTWTVPAGTVVPTTFAKASNPDILFSFGDGLATGGRITNKIVVNDITGGIIDPQTMPVDSSVVKDYDRGAASPDGIY